MLPDVIKGKKMTTIRRIAVTTGGGDAPGLNAVISGRDFGGLKRGAGNFGIL